MKITHSYVNLSLGLLTFATANLANADFLEDSKANLALRNLYFENDFKHGPGSAGQSRTQEWGQAIILNYSSGFTPGPIGFGVDAMGMLGVTLDSGQGRHRGSSMIPDDGDGAAADWSRLGLTAKARFNDTELRYGNLIPKLPILKANDGRLLPQTYQGGQITVKDIPDVTLVAGRLDRATGRASSDRTGLAVSGGTADSQQFLYAGVDYKRVQNALLQYYVANLEDYYTQHFFGVEQTFALNDEQSLTYQLHYFATSSSGANATAGGRAQGYRVNGYSRNGAGEIDNRTWSALGTYQLGGHSVTGGFQAVSNDSDFAQVNQGSLADKGAGGVSYYLYTNRLSGSFNRAGERTWFAEYAYDFAAAGLPGLEASVVYLNADHIMTTGGARQKEWERDIALDYVVQSGTFKGLGLGWRYAMVRSEATQDVDQTRLILSYNFNLL